jgi:hypothetical protein
MSSARLLLPPGSVPRSVRVPPTPPVSRNAVRPPLPSDLAARVDRVGFAVGNAQVFHFTGVGHPVAVVILPQEGYLGHGSRRGVRAADHLARVVDIVRLAMGAAERSQVNGGLTGDSRIQRRVGDSEATRRLGGHARYLSTVVQTERRAERSTARSARRRGQQRDRVLARRIAAALVAAAAASGNQTEAHSGQQDRWQMVSHHCDLLCFFASSSGDGAGHVSLILLRQRPWRILVRL